MSLVKVAEVFLLGSYACMYMPGAQGGNKRALDPLDLELRMVVGPKMHLSERTLIS